MVKRWRWIASGLALALLPVMAWAGIAHAQQFATTVEQGQTVDSSLHSVGRTIDISGTINGDVFCAGKVVNIDATVHGDVLCAGQDVTVNGKVDGDVRIAAQTASVNAEVKQSLSVAAMSFSLDAGATVGRDVSATGDTLNLKGMIGRDVAAAGNTVIFNGKVGRNVRAGSAQVNMKENARIGGNFTYTSNAELQKSRRAMVAGKLTRTATPKHERRSMLGFNLGWYLFLLVGTMSVGLLLAWLFPQFLRKQSGYITEGFGSTMLTGFIASIAMPLILMALAVSLVGIPLGFFLVLYWVAASMLVGPIVGYYAGVMVLRTKKNMALISIVGSALIVSVWSLPFVGFLLFLASYWLGMGSIILGLKARAHPFQARS